MVVIVERITDVAKIKFLIRLAHLARSSKLLLFCINSILFPYILPKSLKAHPWWFTT